MENPAAGFCCQYIVPGPGVAFLIWTNTPEKRTDAHIDVKCQRGLRQHERKLRLCNPALFGFCLAGRMILPKVLLFGN